MKRAFVGILAAFGAVLTITTIALAEDEYDVKASGADITVTAKGPYHVNHEYPWSISKDGKKLDNKVSFSGEAAASFSNVPKGAILVKGAVCKGASECKPFSKQVTVN